jgi:hypothetical protein
MEACLRLRYVSLDILKKFFKNLVFPFSIQRLEKLNEFKDEKLNVLVATDLGILFIVNISFPNLNIFKF